jgi:hypothetical protein
MCNAISRTVIEMGWESKRLRVKMQASKTSHNPGLGIIIEAHLKQALCRGKIDTDAL